MSFNLATKLNNLYEVIKNIQTTSLTNPMVSDLQMANYDIQNCSSISGPASTPLILTADPSQGIQINTKMTIPNHTLSIINNTSTDDSLLVQDTTGGTNAFKVDGNGNVGVRVNPATILTNPFEVQGNAVINGNLTCTSLNGGTAITNITAGNGIVKTGTSTNPIISANLVAGTDISLTTLPNSSIQINATGTGSQNIQQVLTVGNNAGNLSLSGINQLSCAKVNTDNVVCSTPISDLGFWNINDGSFSYDTLVGNDYTASSVSWDNALSGIFQYSLTNSSYFNFTGTLSYNSIIAIGITNDPTAPFTAPPYSNGQYLAAMRVGFLINYANHTAQEIVNGALGPTAGFNPVPIGSQLIFNLIITKNTATLYINDGGAAVISSLALDDIPYTCQAIVNTGAIASTQFSVQEPPQIATNYPVRYSAPQTLTLAPLTGWGYNPATIFTITLPTQYKDCNVFTFYIRSITANITTAGTPATFNFYPSDTVGSATAGAYDANEGAMNEVVYSGITSGTNISSSNLIWNWRPSAFDGSHIYINTDLLGGSQNIATTNLIIIMDIVGEKMTLV